MPATDLRLETPRLLLRPLEMQDFDAFAAFHAEPESMRFLGGVQPREVAWRTLMLMAGAWHLQGISMFSLIEKSTGRWIGRAGPWMPEGWPGPEVGWGVVRDCQGKGYATEAARAAIDWAFDTLGWTEVIHSISPGNAASQAVAAKLGSRNRGPGRLPPPLADVPIEIWGQTRAEWRRR
ncbi:MAG: GNAT family N-acetyltransferase [Steroidobacteraceae bacterium]